MARAVVCPACGTKIKGGRPKCLRCGESLASAEPEAPESIAAAPSGSSALSQFLARRRGQLLASGITLSLGLLFAAVARQPPAYEPPRAAPQPSSPAKPAVTPPLVTEGQPPASPVANNDPPFMDDGRAGGAAYARGDFSTAVSRYQKLVNENPKDVDALNNLGQSLVRIGRAADAIPYFERAIALNGSNWTPRFNLAHAYGTMNDWPKAIIEYRAASVLFPDDYVTHYNLGLALHKAGQEAMAIPELQRAIALAPGEASFHLSLGISYERLNKPAEAAKAYEEYLDLAPTAPDAAKVQSRIETLRKPA